MQHSADRASESLVGAREFRRGRESEMDAEILNLLLKFPPSLEREGAKFSAACLAWLPLTCCLLPSGALVAGIKDGGLGWEKGLFPSATFACLWWKRIKKKIQHY